MNKTSINRRQFLKVAGLTALGATSACGSPAPDSTVTPVNTPPLLMSTPGPTPTRAPQPAGQKQRALRIAHMTDFHAQPEGIAPGEIARAFRHAQSQSDPPDLVLNTGDSVMESLKADKARTEAQWETFNSLVAAECKLPIVHAIGNHDVWGWDSSDQQIKSDPLYGKNMALARLGLANRYYSFDRAGWHFIVLDSTHLPNKVSQYPYIGQLDGEQYQWLLDDLATAGHQTPICLVSHIPILTACMFFDGANEDSGNWVVPAAWMHIDARQFRQLGLQYPNIRLCLSGHTHQHEALDYLGVRYLTNGAICGNWWNGTYMDFPPAYVLVNLYQDGSVDSQFVPY